MLSIPLTPTVNHSITEMGPIKRGHCGKLGTSCTVSNFSRTMHEPPIRVNHLEREEIITGTIVHWQLSAGLDKRGLINNISSGLGKGMTQVILSFQQ